MLDAALSVRGQWARDPEARQEIRQACEELDIALDDYQAVESGADSWLELYPDLVNAADPQPEALERLAGEASVVSAILLMAITASGGYELTKAIIAITQGQNGPQISPAGRAECTASADATPNTLGVHQ